MRGLFVGVAAAALIVGSVPANAGSLWIDDSSGNIGLVDTATGTVSNLHNTGQNLTDIAFLGSQMYGTTFTGLYSINTGTGAATLLGNYTGINGMNALVGAPTSLLGASNNTTTFFNVFLNGSTTSAGTSPLNSAGDLAFAGSTLYESAIGSGGNALVNLTTNNVVGLFHTSSQASFSTVFGLADDGTTMYAVNGTDIYSVNLGTAELTHLSSFFGHGLSDANGTAFLSENTPPVPGPMVGAGLPGILACLGLYGFNWRRKRRQLA